MRLQAVSASRAWIGWPKICPSCIWGRRLWIPGGWKRRKQVHILWLYWFRTSKEAAWGLAHPARDQLIRVGTVLEISSQISDCDFWRCMWTSWTYFTVYRFVVIHFENWNGWCKHDGYLESLLCVTNSIPKLELLGGIQELTSLRACLVPPYNAKCQLFWSDKI